MVIGMVNCEPSNTMEGMTVIMLKAVAAHMNHTPPPPTVAAETVWQGRQGGHEDERKYEAFHALQ
jgi:hypothetical protein